MRLVLIDANILLQTKTEKKAERERERRFTNQKLPTSNHAWLVGCYLGKSFSPKVKGPRVSGAASVAC